MSTDCCVSLSSQLPISSTPYPASAAAASDTSKLEMYGNNTATFDPMFIVNQIVAMQCFYYLGMGTLWGAAYVSFGFPISLDHFFTAKYINFTTYSGWAQSLCFLSAAVAGAYLLSNVVEKSKRCVDFTFTLFFIHIVACTLYLQFPLVWEWWVTQVVASVIMASMGEYLCARTELLDIPLYSDGISQEL